MGMVKAGAYLLVLLILRELLWLILLLLRLCVSLRGRLRELSLRMHLLYLGKIGVPRLIS